MYHIFFRLKHKGLKSQSYSQIMVKLVEEESLNILIYCSLLAPPEGLSSLKIILNISSCDISRSLHIPKIFKCKVSMKFLILILSSQLFILILTIDEWEIHKNCLLYIFCCICIWLQFYYCQHQSTEHFAIMHKTKMFDKKFRSSSHNKSVR